MAIFNGYFNELHGNGRGGIDIGGGLTVQLLVR